MLQRNDIYVYVVDMPVSEAVTPSGAFSYTVYINARLSAERQREALLHALRHIQNDDFSRSDVQEVENHAHS